MPVGRVLTRDVGDGLSAKLEVLVFDDARIRNLALRVVDDSNTLMILFLEALRLEVKTTIFALSAGVVITRMSRMPASISVDSG